MPRLPVVPMLAAALLVAVGWAACRGGRPSGDGNDRDAVYLSDYWEPRPEGEPDVEPIRPKVDLRVRGFYHAVREAGARVLLVAKPRGETRTINVRMRIPTEVIATVGDTQIADLDLGGPEIRVVQLMTPTATAPDTTPDGRRVVVVPYASGRSLSSVFLVKTYTQKREMDALGRPVLDAVSSWEVKEDYPELISVDRFEVPADNCETAAIAEVGDEVVDTSVTFPEIADCSDDECKQAYSAWLRAYHDVKIVLQMLDQVESEPSSVVRGEYWREPFVDSQGDELSDTSLDYYFGEYDQGRFRVIHDVYRHLKKIMTYPGDLEKFGCQSATPSSDCATEGVAAFHGPRGYIGLCSGVFFSEAGDDQLERRARDRVRLLVHEPLHYVWVSWVNGVSKEIDDHHRHRHGDDCERLLTQVDDRKWCQVLHLATYPGAFPAGSGCSDEMLNIGGCAGCSCCGVGDDCSHHDTATINNDSYGFATSEVGAGLRKEGAHHWPPSQYSSTASDDCVVNEVPNPVDPIDTCVYSGGSLQCAGPSIAASDLSLSGIAVACD